MAEPREIPELTTELIDMSREYLRQETIEPAKALGKHAGLGFGGAFLFSLGAMMFVFGLYALLRMVLPETEWYEVLSRFLTFVGALIAAALVGWRISVVNQEPDASGGSGISVDIVDSPEAT